MAQEERPGALRNALAWCGAGAVVGALLRLVVVAVVYGGGSLRREFLVAALGSGRAPRPPPGLGPV